MENDPLHISRAVNEVAKGYQLRALPTEYRGVRFRSRLEARWALFFDSLRVAWEYEREGFDLGEGRWYLPDFWLPQQQCWIEIKGKDATDVEKSVCFALCTLTEKDVYLFAGGFHSRCDLEFISADAWWYSDEGSMEDGGYYWCECPTCHCFGIQFEGRADRLPCKKRGCFRKSKCADRGHNADSARLVSAYRDAMGYKFV